MGVISMLCNTYTEVLLLIHKNSHNMLTPSARNFSLQDWGKYDKIEETFTRLYFISQINV